jgi:short-subunit dehydrogenase
MMIIINKELSMSTSKGTALVTGASAGIGATYADRLAKQGYDLILVARDAQKMDTLAGRLRAETGVRVDVLRADLTAQADLAKVEQRLRDDASITLLVNNAGAGAPGSFSDTDIERHQSVIDLNITAVVRLAHAIIPGFLARGGGTIVNIASVLGYLPEISLGVYAATKSFVITFSRSLQIELADKGIHVQAVLPAGTRTDIWEKVGRSVDDFPAGTIMGVDDMVDASLLGLARGELITLPSLPDEGQYQAFEAARLAMAQNFSNDKPAPRYRASVASGIDGLKSAAGVS